MTSDKIVINPGDILIASPLLADPNFRRSVILILDRDKENGYIGLVLNQQLNLSLHDISEINPEDDSVDDTECDDDDQNSPEFDPDNDPFAKSPLFKGGPVDLQRLFWIHSLGPLIPGSLEVLPGVFVGGDYDAALDYVRNNPDSCTNKIRFYLGYSGWIHNQLEKEVELGVWHVNHLPDPDSVVASDPDVIWTEQVKAAGPQIRHWLMMPPDPSLN